MTLTVATLLEAYDEACRLHPNDRAVLLRSLIADNQTAGPDEPVGQRNAGLLRLHATLVGPNVRATTTCPNCTERIEIEVETSALLDGARRPPTEVTVGGRRFAPVTSRHLAAVAAASDSDPCRSLLAACSLDDDPQAEPIDIEAVEAALEDADPMADIVFALNCESCEHEWDEFLDVPALVWTEVGQHIAELLDDVHLLASTYGWSEHDALALAPWRRQAYIDRILR